MKALHISTFSPTPCGIATYTEDLVAHLPQVNSVSLRMEYGPDSSSTTFWRTIPIQEREAYTSAADAINKSDVTVVSLQHEFGIYGGPAGHFITLLAERLEKPLVTTLHTTSALLPATKSRILKTLIERSDMVVVLREESAELLKKQFGAEPNKVKVIRHGIPDIPFAFPEEIAFRKPHGSELVFVSAGHLRPSKGYDVALAALAKLKHSGTKFQYLVLGTSQPQWDKGGRFALHFEHRINDLGLQAEVVWVKRYLKLADLLQHIQAADLGLVTYTEPDQISSGILPMILGCGRPVIATGFDCAKSIARSLEGLYLAEMNNPDSVLQRIIEVTACPGRLREVMVSNYSRMRPCVWRNSAQSYLDVFHQAVRRKSPHN